LDVPPPMSPLSRSSTFSPRIAASRAMPAPLIPAPITITSNWRISLGIEAFKTGHEYSHAPYSANPARSRAKFLERGFEGLIDNEEINSSDLKTKDRPVATAPGSLFVNPPAVDVR